MPNPQNAPKKGEVPIPDEELVDNYFDDEDISDLLDRASFGLNDD